MAEIKVELNSGNQEPIVINRGRLTQLSSLSQSTSSPDSIQYGTIANSGSIEMTDYNEDIKALIKDGTLNPSDVDVSLYVNNNLVQKHLSTDSNYDSADKTFNISLSNKVKDMETLKYGGYVYQDTAISVFDLLKDVLSSFLGQTLSDANLETMLSAYMIHPTEGTKVHIYEYAKEINIKYPSIEYGRTYRDVIDELCTILQCYMYVDDDDNIIFESARPLVAINDVSNAIRITKDKMYSPLKDAVILKNKFDGIEISCVDVSEEPKTDDEIAIQTLSTNPADYPTITSSELYTTVSNDNYSLGYNQTTGTVSTGGSTKAYADYLGYKNYYASITFNVDKRFNNGLSHIDAINNYLIGDNYKSYKNHYYKEEMSLVGATYDTSTQRFTSFTSETKNWSYGIGNFLDKVSGSTYTSYSIIPITENTNNIDCKDESSISYVDQGSYYSVTCKVLIGQDVINIQYLQNSASDDRGYIIKYRATETSVSILGRTINIVFNDYLERSENIETAKTIASVSSSGKLIQNVTQVGSTQSSSWEDGVKITDVIKSTILDDYDNGISNATVTICCDDFYNAGGTKVIDWSQGQTLQVGQVVFFTDDKYSDDTQRYWRITGRRFYWEGAPYCDLELQEVVSCLLSGLYDNNWNMLYSWDELINNNYITILNNSITASDKNNLNGQLVIAGDESIGPSAFGGCNGLTNVIIQQGITSIGTYAFNSCRNLLNVIMPNSITTIGERAFSVCDKLEYIQLSNNITSIENGVFSNCNSLLEINIPNTVTNIGEYAFSGCRSLTEIYLPTNITTIGQGAFGYCYGLTNITIPNNVSTIKAYTFGNCSGLTNIIMPSDISIIKTYAFSACTGLLVYDFSSATSIPTRETNSMQINTNTIIVVPNSLYDSWIASSDWSSIAGRIVKVSDFEANN